MKWLIKKKQNLYKGQIRCSSDKKNKDIMKTITDKKKPTVDKKNYKLPVLIAVCSLDQRIGCSHTAISISNYIDQHSLNDEVCMINNREKDLEADLTEFIDYKQFKEQEIQDIYGKYDFLVMDFGNLNLLSEKELMEIKRSNEKIMICRADREYLKQLVAFIQEEDNINQWIFFFHFVPEENKKEVYALMEEYRCYILPIYDRTKENKEVNKIYKKLF